MPYLEALYGAESVHGLTRLKLAVGAVPDSHHAAGAAVHVQAVDLPVRHTHVRGGLRQQRERRHRLRGALETHAYTRNVLSGSVNYFWQMTAVLNF